ncbi:hypothetical protein ACNOYE_29520 [Nannocystaceae bacterium ST9]
MSESLAERLRRGDEASRLEIAGAPIRLAADNLVERPWGGRWLLELKRLGERPGKFGESFELAAEPDDREAAEHPSQVVFADGSTMPLPELLALAGPALLGDRFFTAYGPRIPLLPKLLDVEGLLSVQTHPPGHPELYVIVDAEPGASLRLGWRRDVDPGELAERFHEGRALQDRLIAGLREGVDFELVQRSFARVLGRERVASDQAAAIVRSLAPHLRPELDPDPLLALVVRAVELYHDILDRMNVLAIRPGDVIYNARPSDPRSTHVPSAEIHALGDPGSKRALIFEVRRPGVTHRAWDHLRFPVRALAIDEAIATMSCAASAPEQFRVEPRPLPGRPGVRRSIECPAFVVDHLRPTLGQAIELRAAELPGSLHGLRGEVELVGLAGESLGRLRAGESVLLPHAHDPFVVRATIEPTELLQITVPLAPSFSERSGPIRSPAAAAKRANWADLHRIVARSQGPREVVAIVNGGDGPSLAAHLERMSTRIFRADGATEIAVHEEPTRRGQLLGLLDALREHPLDPDHVALGIMLPGKGTRLSPLTQRLRGIKPLMPVPIRPSAEGPWLDAATASLYSWVLVGATLERLGFRGVAWKWGDEPQIPAHVLAQLDRELASADAVRFGAQVEVDEDLARNKEWLAVDPIAGDLRVQVRRRSLAELRERLGVGADQPLRAHVNLGSPAFSHRFLAAAQRWFGDCEGWLDVDGYLFEALTHDDASWAAELARDPGLRALIERVPDFHARARGLRATLEAERGRALRIAVIDFGAELHWCDVGQLGKAREAFAALAHPGETGEFARVLASLDAIEPDRWGNVVAGRSAIPDDGSVRDCVIVDSTIGAGPATRAVILHAELGHARLEPGSVAIDCRVQQIELGRDALAFGSRVDHLAVREGWVHTSIARDPASEVDEHESWWADSRDDPGAAHNYESVVWGNPDSFAAKFEQMRRRPRAR